MLARRHAAWVLALLLLLSACAQLETATREDQVFELAGRIAARQGGESFSGNVAWRHAGGGDELLLTSPLGQGVARIVRDREGVVLTTAEPREYRAPDAESLTEQALGFRLPLAGLADWVRARPSGGSAFEIEKDSAGRVKRLAQRGWKIEYLEYGEQSPVPLPARLRLTYPGVDIRLAISSWK